MLHRQGMIMSSMMAKRFMLQSRQHPEMQALVRVFGLFHLIVIGSVGASSSLSSTIPMVSPPQIASPGAKAIFKPAASVAEPPKGLEVVVQTKTHHYHTELLLAIVLASFAILAILSSAICVFVFWQRRSCNNSAAKDIESSDAAKEVTLGPILSKFSSYKASSKKGMFTVIEYASLESATNNFSDKNTLAEGGMYSIYKACFRGGNFAAVKKFNRTGQDYEREFENELDTLADIRHPNIVSLFGYCVNGEARFLVYELMQNGSLDAQLHGPSHGSALTWQIRMKIALDIARGLEYLHEHCNPPVIHRDLKSSNILLNSEFNAKISDFGLALAGGGSNRSNAKLSGTIGYVAPEYLLDGKLTEKSDVYAFGVILLELLLRRKPVEKTAPSQCQSIVTWAMPQLTDRAKLPSIVDPVIRNSMDLKHLYQVAAVAVLCVQPEPSYRPLITDVLHSLIPLVPVELGGTLKIVEASKCVNRIINPLFSEYTS